MKREAFAEPAAAPAPAPSPRLRLLSGLLADAGITLDGDAPCDLQMRNPRLPERVFAYGSLGLGEAYMDATGTPAGSTNSSPACCAPGWTRGSSRHRC